MINTYTLTTNKPKEMNIITGLTLEESERYKKKYTKEGYTCTIEKIKRFN